MWLSWYSSIILRLEDKLLPLYVAQLPGGHDV